MLPVAGYRLDQNGALNLRGAYGSYWSSSKSMSNKAFVLSAGGTIGVESYVSRLYGFSVRCISE
jgi:hypothetical protein